MEKIKALALITATILLSMTSIKMAISLVTNKVSMKTPQNELKVFRQNELKKYDGSNQGQPIYLAYNGLIYDVTPGRKFYEVGGAYHFLAGRDCSIELNIAGGGIVKSKYKVIGKLVK